MKRVTLIKVQARGRRLRGFTLIEMLVAVMVVAVLVVVAGRVAAGGLVAGKQAKCASNLRQIGTAILVYANDHEGALPSTTHSTGPDVRGSWIYALKPYLGNVDEVRISPGDPRGAERLEAEGTSYILNSYVFVPRVGPFGEALPGSMTNIRVISQPSRTLFAANISDEQGASAQNDHTHSERWGGEDGRDRSWDALCRDIQPDRFTTRVRPDHTEGSANYLFADGHVENIAAVEVKRRLESGDNIARPPGI